jgi:tRNA1(Val) A37 N6-methylase TrmN6
VSGEPPELTQDTLLAGRVRLSQPAAGYRVAIDPVFLAAVVPAEAGDAVLDVGTGVGAAALCLAWRVPGCRVTGLESQSAMARLAMANAEANAMQDRITILIGDLLRPPPRLSPASFDHVMANPPHLAGSAASPTPDAGKAASNVEGEAKLADWLRFCLTMAKPKGSISLVHRADRLDALLADLRGQAGEITVFPLWPGGARPATRVLVRARRGSAAPTRLAAGLVLHETDGSYSAAAQAVLRDGAALVL